MKTLRSFLSVVDLQTLLVSLLAVAATWVCLQLGLAANMPTGLIGVAIIFPIVFSINAAYRRREEALRYFASFKGHGAALFYAHRDWTPQAGPKLSQQLDAIFQELIQAFIAYFIPAPKRTDGLQGIYQIFSRLSQSHEELRQAGVPANEISRANQYLRSMVIEFERMRNIRDYRTPLPLRAYSRVFLNTFPVLFGPYFAHLAQSHYLAVGYGVAVLYSLVLVSLDNIQEHLEDPFDGVGEDDVRLDVVAEWQEITSASP